jgi:phenylpyruvate tautomerase PptA (4-oxalocrotonate tautomerase family)
MPFIQIKVFKDALTEDKKKEMIAREYQARVSMAWRMTEA